MARKPDGRKPALAAMTNDLRAAYNSLLAIYEASKDAKPTTALMLQELDKTRTLIERADLAIRLATSQGLCHDSLADLPPRH